MKPGLYLTFFTEGEPLDGELPPVGPLEHVVVQDGALIADRKDDEPADSFGSGSRWIEAEYEFQRAIGNEPGGARRPDLRVIAPQGVYLRFVSFGSSADHDPVPELGPYAVVVVGKTAVEADGDRLASRIGHGQRMWRLSAAGGTALLGVTRPDIAFRTRSTVYHPELKPFRPDRRLEPAAMTPTPAAPVRQRPSSATVAVMMPVPASLPAAAVNAPPGRAIETAAQKPAAIEVATITLRDRIRAEQSTAPPNAGMASATATGREWAGAAWRLRFAIIAALAILIVVFSVPSLRSLLGGGTTVASVSTVSAGASVSSPAWNYSVGSVRRVAKIGGASARGIFIVVQVAATNLNGAGAHLLPSGFALANGNGDTFSALAVTSNVYSGDVNPTSSYAWPTEFPVGRSVVVPVIFEVAPSVSGTQLVIFDVPSTRVRLE